MTKRIGFKIVQGDAFRVLEWAADNSVDALVTDPPAGISFMGKTWDADKGGRDHWIAWLRRIMQECYRVMKPGAHGVVWALPRTSHWTATALEDAGFEIRDVITHVFGSGFPKSLDVSKAIDKAAGAEREVVGTKKRSQNVGEGWDRPWRQKQMAELGGSGMAEFPITAPATDDAKRWSGWGTAIKPASEHWLLIRKPLSERNVAANVLKWGTGAINIDGCRVGDNAGWSYPNGRGGKGCFGRDSLEANLSTPMEASKGRFPANLIVSGSARDVLDEQTKDTRAGKPSIGSRRGGRSLFGNAGGTAGVPVGHDTGDVSGASRFFADCADYPPFLYCAKPSRREKNAGCEGMPERVVGTWGGEEDDLSDGHKSTIPRANHHPTVKPVKLMRYLCRLITPPGGTVLDPFAGSGTTGVAAILEGFRFIGIEREAEYVEIARARIEHAQLKRRGKDDETN